MRGEVAQLRAALYQYQMAEQGLASALDRQVGSGCRVSDFYTQAGMVAAVACDREPGNGPAPRRDPAEAYLGATDPGSVPKVHAVAQQAFRATMIDGYVKLIGMAGLVRPRRRARPARWASGRTARWRPRWRRT